MNRFQNMTTADLEAGIQSCKDIISNPSSKEIGEWAFSEWLAISAELKIRQVSA